MTFLFLVQFVFGDDRCNINHIWWEIKAFLATMIKKTFFLNKVGKEGLHYSMFNTNNHATQFRGTTFSRKDIRNKYIWILKLQCLLLLLSCLQVYLLSVQWATKRHRHQWWGGQCVSTLWGIMVWMNCSPCPLPVVPLSVLALLTLPGPNRHLALVLTEGGWGWGRLTLRVCRAWHSTHSNREDTVRWLWRNTPRTKGPLFRCDGHRRRCPGLDAEIFSLPFRVTGFREDVGHTLKVQTHVRSVCYSWSHTRMTKYERE